MQSAVAAASSARHSRFIDAVLHGRPPRVDGQGTHTFWPVYVDDVAAPFESAVRVNARGTFNVGGEPRIIHGS